MESQYQLQLQEAELETKHEEELKQIKETHESELKKQMTYNKQQTFNCCNCNKINMTLMKYQIYCK